MINVKMMYELYKKDLEEYKRIENYFLGKTDAIINYKQTDRSNLKVACNYVKKFVKEETSYSVGNAVTYQSKAKDKKSVEAIDSILENFKENHDIDLFRNMILSGVAYEIKYIDKWGQLQAKVIKRVNGYAKEDNNGEVEAFIHVYPVTVERDGKFIEVDYMDLYTLDAITSYDDKYSVVAEPKVNIFDEIPVHPAKLSDYMKDDTIYSDIKGLQDALETNLSDICNEISDFRNAYLVLSNCSIEGEELKDIKEKGVINFVTEGKAEWLIKNINDTFIQNTVNTLCQKIYELTSHLNHNDSEATSNASGVALKSRLISLMQRCKTNEGAYRECLKGRIRIIAEWLKINNIYTIDIKDIYTTFTPCIPNDDKAIADLIPLLRGLVSDETLISMLSFVENAGEEVKKAKDEEDIYNEANVNINKNVNSNTNKGIIDNE